MITKKKKVRRVSRGQVVKRLDTVFSQYIRLKDAVLIGGEWMATCVTCGLQQPWKYMQDGHYESRGNLPTRWAEDNNHVQCMPCNVYKKGNYTVYARYMIERYGADKLDDLAKRAKSTVKIPTIELYEMIEDYKAKVATLLTRR